MSASKGKVFAVLKNVKIILLPYPSKQPIDETYDSLTDLSALSLKGSTIVGLSRKGKEFFNMTSLLSEKIHHLSVEGERYGLRSKACLCDEVDALIQHIAPGVCGEYDKT